MSNVKNALASKASGQAAKPGKSIKQLLIAQEGQIAKALPSVMTPERFTRIAMTALSTNPKLQACTGESFLGALMQAAQLGLEPNTPLGQAYLIPYENRKKGVVECQFQLGYKGLIELAHRSGEFKSIYAQTVYENDEFSFELGLDANLIHKPVLGSSRGKPIAYYAVYKLVNGGYGFEVMSYDDVMDHAKQFSKSVNNGPWKTNFDEMAKKTVLKKVLKYAPIKTEFARGIAQDETVKSGIDEDMASQPDELDYIDVAGPSVDPETGEELFDGMTSAELDAELAKE